MKTLKIKDQSSLPVKGWTFARTYVCGKGRGAKIWGWELRAPDGYRRFNEGNWEQFVSFVRLVMSNHSYECNIS